MELEQTEPNIGFSVSYYDRKGLHCVPVTLHLHDARTPEAIGKILFQAYSALCHGLQPLPTQPQKTGSIKDAVRNGLGDPPEAA